jgi:hypothetical protein
MSKTLMLFALLVVVALVFSALTVRSFLRERRAAALPPEPEQDSPGYPTSPPRPY